jgi:hypothetical protein
MSPGSGSREPPPRWQARTGLPEFQPLELGSGDAQENSDPLQFRLEFLAELPIGLR